MWDQKTGITVSAPEGSERISGGSGSNHQLIQDKKIFDSCGEDSGFLSSELLSSQSIDSHSNIVGSSARVTVAPPLAVRADDKFIDSGVIEIDDEDERDDITKDTQQEPKPMIVQSGVDVGLSEWFCGLSLKNSSLPLNNLSSDCRKEGVEEDRFARIKKQLQDRPLWEICYVQDADGDTQLHLAILGKHVQAVWAIIRLAPLPAFLDLRNDDAHSPLHLAVLTKQPEIVRCLILAGADTTTQDKEGNSPLHLACMNNDKACVDALTMPVTHEEVQRYYNFANRIPQVLPPDLEQRNYQGERCVHIAALRNNIEILRHLVWLGADINAREGLSGYTALHFACDNGNELLAQFLLTECSKIDVETCTFGRLTAYQLAAELNNHSLMSGLERYGAELLSPPESDDDSYSEDDSSEDDFEDYESDDCELN